MGKMSFGESKQPTVVRGDLVAAPVLEPQIIEKIIEVPVEIPVNIPVEIIKEVYIPGEKEIIIKYDEVALKSLSNELKEARADLFLADTKIERTELQIQCITDDVDVLQKQLKTIETKFNKRTKLQLIFSALTIIILITSLLKG